MSPVIDKPYIPHPGAPMPIVQVFMIEGRTEDQKRAVIEKVSAALVEATGAPKEAIRVWIQEVPKTNWGIAGQTAKDLGR